MNVKLIGDQDAKPGGRFDTPNLQHAEKSLGRTGYRAASQGRLLLYDCFLFKSTKPANTINNNENTLQNTHM